MRFCSCFCRIVYGRVGRRQRGLHYRLVRFLRRGFITDNALHFFKEGGGGRGVCLVNPTLNPPMPASISFRFVLFPPFGSSLFLSSFVHALFFIVPFLLIVLAFFIRSFLVYFVYSGLNSGYEVGLNSSINSGLLNFGGHFLCGQVAIFVIALQCYLNTPFITTDNHTGIIWGMGYGFHRGGFMHV